MVCTYQFDNCWAHPIYSTVLHAPRQFEVDLARSPPVQYTLNLVIFEHDVPIKYQLVANNSMHHSKQRIGIEFKSKWMESETVKVVKSLLRIALGFYYHFYSPTAANGKRYFLFPFPSHSLWLLVQGFVSYRFYPPRVNKPISKHGN